MDIVFRARNVEVPDMLRGRTSERVARLDRLRGRLSRRQMVDRQGSVHFGAHRYGAKCGHAAHGPTGEATIVTTQVATAAMTPEDAALEMARLSDDLDFFVDAETAAGAVVYRRRDGGIGLIVEA